jgi:anaerobic selenocysteine-containing dehydrogenase
MLEVSCQIREENMQNETFNLCFVCSVRCPIRVVTQNGEVKWIEGDRTLHDTCVAVKQA